MQNAEESSVALSLVSNGALNASAFFMPGAPFGGQSTRLVRARVAMADACIIEAVVASSLYVPLCPAIFGILAAFFLLVFVPFCSPPPPPLSCGTMFGLSFSVCWTPIPKLQRSWVDPMLLVINTRESSSLRGRKTSGAWHLSFFSGNYVLRNWTLTELDENF